MTLLKRISAYTFISGFTGAVSFLILPVITKYLTPEDYGVLSVINATIRLFGAIISLGITNILMVNLIKYKPIFGKYFKSFLFLAFATTGLLTLFIFIYYKISSFTFGIPFKVAITLPFIGLLVTLFDSFSSIVIFLKDLKNYTVYALSKFGIEIGGIFLFIVLLLLNWKGRILALVVSLIFACLYGFIYLKKKKLLNGKTKPVYAFELLKQGGPLIFLNLSIMIINLSDRYFIEYMLNEKATGLYSMAATISGILLLIIGASMNVFRPLLYEKLNLSSIRGKDIKKITIRYTAIIFFTGVMIFIVSPLIFNLLINSSYSESATYIPVLLTGLFFWGMYNFYVSYLMYYKKSRLISITAFGSIFVNLFANYYLIQNYHTIGAAYATMLTYFILFLITYLQVKKINPSASKNIP